MKGIAGAFGVVFVLALLAYFPTLCPTIYVGDSGELALAAASLGIAHPPGFPLWTWLGRLAVLAGGGEAAWALNVLSALCAAAAAGLLSVLVAVWSGRVLASVAIGLCFAFSRPVWSVAVITEVYSLNLLMTAAALVAAVLSRRGRPRLALLAAFLVGLGAANHPFALLAALPVVALAVVPRPAAQPLAFGRLPAMVGAFALGLSAYLAIPIRWAAGADTVWGGFRSMPEVVDHVLRTQYGGLGEATAAATLVDRWRVMVELLVSSVPWPFLALAGAGAAFVWMDGHRKRALVLLGFLVLAGPVTAAAIRFEDTFFDRSVIIVYFLPMILAVYCMAGCGVAAVDAWVSRRSAQPRLASIFTAVVSVVMVGFVHEAGVEVCDRSESTLARAYASRALNELPQGARLYAIGDAECFALHYFHRVEGVRPDVKLVDRSLNLFVDSYGEDFPQLSRSQRAQMRAEREIELAYAEPDRPVFYVERVDMSAFPGCRLAPVGLVYQFLRPGETEASLGHEPVSLPQPAPDDYLESMLAGAAYFREAEYFLRVERPDDARRSLRASARAAPRIGAVLRNVALAHLTLGDAPEAEVRLDAALATDSHDTRSRYTLALLYAQTNRVEQSLAEFDRLLDQGVDLPEVHLNHGVQLVRAGRLEEARAAAHSALAIVPDLESAGRLVEAVDYGLEIGGETGALEAGRRVGAVTMSGTLQLAQRYLAQGDLPRATELYREVAERSPENVSAAYGLGYALIQVGRYEEAADSFRWILAVKPESADARNALAYVLAQTGDSLRTAEALVLEALELDPSLAAYWNDTLGWVRYRAGDYHGAVEALTKAKETLPIDDVSMLAENDYHLGSAFAELGRIEEAKGLLRSSARRVKSEAWSLELRARLRELGIEEGSI